MHASHSWKRLNSDNGGRTRCTQWTQWTLDTLAEKFMHVLSTDLDWALVLMAHHRICVEVEDLEAGDGARQ